MEDAGWYPRMGDIPGVEHQAPQGLDRTTIPGWDAVPEISSSEYEGRRHVQLWWGGDGFGTSAAPAHRADSEGDAATVSVPEALDRLWRGLELPGTASDYHFLIQGTAARLSSIRRAHPGLAEEVEKLWWLDIRLLQAVPAAVTSEHARDGGPEFYVVTAFDELISLYMYEGYVQEARKVAEIAAQFGQGSVVPFLKRIEALEAEESL